MIERIENIVETIILSSVGAFLIGMCAVLVLAGTGA